MCRLSEAERLVFAQCETPMQHRMVSVGGGIEMSTWSSVGSDSKPPLVCMHGWGASSAFWHLTIDTLARHYKIYLADWVGFGRSSSHHFTGSTPQDAEDYWIRPFEAWREAMSLKRFVLAGHSLGGYLCCAYACTYPLHVAALILVSPGGFTTNSTVLDPGDSAHEADPARPDEEWEAAAERVESVAHHAANHEGSRDDDSSRSPPPSAQRKALNIIFCGITITPAWHNVAWSLSPSRLIRALGPYGRKRIISVLQQRWGSTTSAAFTEYTYHLFARSGGHPGEDATRSIFKPIAVPYRPLSERVALLAMPSLWLYGDEDWMLVESAVECKALISPTLHARTHVVVVPQSTHQIMLDASEAVADAMVNFINSAGKRVGRRVNEL